MKCLIQILSLQATTQSKIRLTADNLVLYRKILNSLSQKTVSSSIFISESTSYNSLNFSKKNTTILSLIKNTQEFDLQCRQISSQLHEKSEKNLSFVLHENEILKKTDHVYISHQKTIQNQLLELYHDCSSEDHWDRNKTLKLVQHHFIWNRIADNIHIYIATCLICQSKAIHHHWSYDQLESLSISKNTWNSSFKEISLDWIMRLFLSMKTKNSQKYNSILIVVCCITKYALFILTWDDTTAADFTELFFEHVECHFDFSRNIVMNRDSCITSDF